MRVIPQEENFASDRLNTALFCSSYVGWQPISGKSIVCNHQLSGVSEDKHIVWCKYNFYKNDWHIYLDNI